MRNASLCGFSNIGPSQTLWMERKGRDVARNRREEERERWKEAGTHCFVISVILIHLQCTEGEERDGRQRIGGKRYEEYYCL